MGFYFVKSAALGRHSLTGRLRDFGLLAFSLVFFAAAQPALAQSQQPAPSPQSTTSAGTGTDTTPDTQLPHPQFTSEQSSGSIIGTVADQSGAFVSGAVVTLAHPGQTATQQMVTDEGGQFFFTNVATGDFTLTIASGGLASQTLSGTLHEGEVYQAPKIVLAVATTVTEVHVTLTREQLSEEQVKIQEKQRVLGIVPNFFVTYDPDAPALTTKQKFSLSWKSSVDPFTILAVGAVAGAEQRTNTFKEYGQGAQGYFKRYGATYADVFDGTMLGGAVFPMIFKQDPRYFYKGTGSVRSRLLYALRSALICKSDDGRWEPNYSNVLGNFAAGGIANAYYPANKRGVGLTFETGGIRIAETALAGVFQEFVIRKLTPNAPKRNVSQP